MHLTILWLVAYSFSTGSSHSWLSCTRMEGDTCRGYIRNWYKQPSEPFSRDQGWDQRPGRSVAQGGLVCGPKQQANAQISDGYSEKYPMTVYEAGKSYQLQWPAKNHARVSNPDRGVQLFIARGPGLGDDYSHITSLNSWCSKYPSLCNGFYGATGPNSLGDSNCSPNEPGVDGADCRGSFTIPADLAPGVYSMMWWWEFNAGEYYNSCFDVNVISSSGGGSGGQVTAPPGTGDQNDPCIAQNRKPNQCPIFPADVGNNGLALVKPPATIPSAVGSTFSVTVRYKVTQATQIVVDILAANGANTDFYGGGLGNAVAITGSGDVEVPITIQVPPSRQNGANAPALSDATGVYIKAWIVPTTQFSTNADDKPWTNELTRVEQPISVGTTLLACDEDVCSLNNGVVKNGSTADGGRDFGIALGVILLLAAVTFGVLCILAMVGTIKLPFIEKCMNRGDGGNSKDTKQGKDIEMQGDTSHKYKAEHDKRTTQV